MKTKKMKQYKNAFILIATGIIIVLCALFPVLTAKIQDAMADDNVSYEEVKTMQFFKERSPSENLVLLRSGTSATISEEKTKLKSKNMEEIIAGDLSPYTDMNLLYPGAADYTIENCEAKLYYDSNSSEISGIFWFVDLKYSGEYESSAELCLDDQTGKILSITYLTSIYMFDESILEECLSNFVYIYCENLGIWDEIIGETELNIEQNNEKLPPYRETYVYMNDSDYGDVGISFCVYTNGFYCSIW